MLRKLQNEKDDIAYRDAVIAFQDRFNVTDIDAIELIKETPVNELADLAKEIYRQADAFESVALILISDNRISIDNAVVEITTVLKNKRNNIYQDRGHVSSLHAKNLNVKYIQYGFSEKVIARLDEWHQKKLQETHKDIDFEEENARLAEINAREHPKPRVRTEREKAQDLYDYTHKLIMTEVGLNAEQATVAMEQIPVDQYNSVYHHLQGKKGFSVRFNTYIDKIMASSSLTFEQALDWFIFIAKGGDPKETPTYKLFNSNEMDTIYKFQKWHFTLLSEATCNMYRTKYVWKYQKKNETAACAPMVESFMMKVPNITSSIVGGRIGFGNTKINSNTNLNILTSCCSALAVIGVIIKICQQQSWACFFSKNKSRPGSKLKPALPNSEKKLRLA